MKPLAPLTLSVLAAIGGALFDPIAPTRRHAGPTRPRQRHRPGGFGRNLMAQFDRERPKTYTERRNSGRTVI